MNHLTKPLGYSKEILWGICRSITELWGELEYHSSSHGFFGGSNRWLQKLKALVKFPQLEGGKRGEDAGLSLRIYLMPQIVPQNGNHQHLFFMMQEPWLRESVHNQLAIMNRLLLFDYFLPNISENNGCT